jgi:hypothetical protein
MTTAWISTMSRTNVSHYTAGDIECIDYIADQGHMVGYCLGNIIKYASRCMLKGTPSADLEKIRRYSEMLEDYLDGRREPDD